MDFKKYTEIGGREALERLSNGLDIYNNVGVKFKIDFEQLDYTWETSDKMVYYGEEDVKPVTLIDVLKETWYVKNQFDVRTEMLERPNEWVGAFKDAAKWFKVGFREYEMKAVSARFNRDDSPLEIGTSCTEWELNACISIEDVPTEELK